MFKNSDYRGVIINAGGFWKIANFSRHHDNENES